MRRFLILTSIALLPLALASSADALSERGLVHLRAFIGLWEGLDPVDGGHAHMSISCARDGMCQLVRIEDVVGLCGGVRALIKGIGGLDGRSLAFPEAVAECPDGDPVTFSISFRPDRFNRTIVSTSTVGGEPLRNIAYYKVSR
jgi:hypothetical protein